MTLDSGRNHSTAKGIVQVTAGHDFVFYVKQEQQSVETFVRNDLRAQDVFDLIFFDTQPDAVFYETILPDSGSCCRTPLLFGALNQATRRR